MQESKSRSQRFNEFFLEIPLATNILVLVLDEKIKSEKKIPGN